MISPRWQVFAVFSLAHFVSNFVRTANAVIADALADDVGLGAAELGLMTSVFFLAFAAAQLPLGSGLDRWGARWVTPTLMLAAVAGSLVFAVAGEVWSLAVGRTLMGLGTAGVLMGGLKALAGWFPSQRFAAVSGAMVAIGSSGSLLAATPLAWLSNAFGWRAVFAVSAGVLLGTALLVNRLGRAAPHVQAAGPAPSGGFGRIFRQPSFWRFALLAITTTGATFAYQSLWAGPYLTRGHGLSPVAAGNVLLAYGIGISLGYLVLGALAERLGVARVLAGGALAFVLLQSVLAAMPATGGGTLAATFFGMGLAGAASALIFTLARQAFPLALTGRAVTAVNLFMFLGGFGLQWALGWWLEVGPGDAAAYGRLFLATALLAAFALLVFLPELRGAPARREPA